MKKNKIKSESLLEATRRMANSPDCWPNWPLLPLTNRSLKDRHGFPQMGVLVDGQPLTVILTNMWEFNPNAEKRVFESVDNMISQGWLVD